MSEDLKIRTLQLVINSRDREDYNTTSSTNFIVKLLNPINFDILAYGLESACIPKTSYNVTAGDLEILDSSGVNQITIPSGNYTITNLTQELQTQLNALSVDTYTVTSSTTTFKLTITSSFAGFTLNPNAGDFPFSNTIGFNNSVAYPSTAGVLVSPKVVDLSGIKNVYIKIKQLTEYMRDTKNLSSNFKVDYGCAYGSIIYFANENKYLQYYTTAQNHIRRTDNFEVRLVDESNNDVDLNGSDWSFVLRFLTKDLY